MSHSLVVWRHGQTPWNVANRFQGHSDVALDDVGRQQAEAAAEALAALGPDAIVSSDLMRARDTADALARRTGRPVVADPALREAYAAAWEGMTRDDILRTDAAGFHRWRTDPAARPGGTGETAAEVADRMGAAVQRHLADRDDGGTLVVVTHGGAARALIGWLLGWPVEVWRALAVMGNCSWAQLETDPAAGWRLVAYNRGIA
jgi:probable phosphoglycerate mutase